MPATTDRRVIRVIIPFAPSGTGSRIGSVRITTPKPYASVEYYTVSIAADGLSATWMKETGDKSTHSVDLDMMACDCPGWNYRRKCRHLEAHAVLQAAGKV